MKRWLAVAAVMTVAGCASSGTKIEQDQLNNIVPGQTTMQNMVQYFGSPLTQSYGSDGHLVANWSYVHVGPFGMGMKNQMLSVLFNDDGTVQKYSMLDGASPGTRIGY